ncbi:MAG: PaaI family thioesterase [Candidatus Thermoplasmatota archaeon]|jgi:uncharacterized protein (TIGR00369 family)|nr:PaaI family thioesterase [Candidatus Thermoplasmatota archaeon]MCL5786018.1 PaaI family thioesterase [Candidatus Thermoplasmatota archaeon]
MAVTFEEMKEVVKLDPFLKLFDFRVVSSRIGEVVLECDLRDHLLRIGGTMNGGAIMSLLDAAGGLCILTKEDVLNQVTSSLSINFLRPISKGPVRTRGKLIKGGRNLAYTQIEVMDGDGKLAASAMGTWFLFR